jgi:tetratricopeptide (TPR) repeat protein
MEILYYIYEKVKTVKHAPSSNKLGLLFLKKALIKEAIEQFRIALEIEPNFVEVFANLGRALIIADSYDEAIEVLNKGAEKAPHFADMQNYLGIAYLRQEKFPKAMEHLEAAIKLNPDYVGAHYHLGMAHLGQAIISNGGQALANDDVHEMTMEHLNLAAERMTDWPIPNFQRVLELVSQRAYKEAWEVFCDSSPRDTLTHVMNIENEFYLKFMYGGKGKDDHFIAEYVQKLENLIVEHPDYADLKNNLGIANLIQCRNLFLKALDEFRAALKINPDFKRAEKNLKLAENDGKGFLILLRAILK